jgi:hypothetical protein
MPGCGLAASHYWNSANPPNDGAHLPASGRSHRGLSGMRPQTPYPLGIDMTRTWRILGLSVVVLILLVTTYNGLVEGMLATRFADTPGMRVATGTQLLYGVFGAATLVALMARRSWVVGLLSGWGLAVVLTAALAPVVYGGTSLANGASAGVGAAVVVAILLWVWRRHAAALIVH